MLKFILYILWFIVRGYGELRWKMNRGPCEGYYWAVRFCCNICHRNWYGKYTEKIFNYVGFIRW